MPYISTAKAGSFTATFGKLLYKEVQKEMWIYNIINSMHCFWFLVLFSIGGLVGFTIICISFYLIIWGILNTYKIKELFLHVVKSYIDLTIFLYVGVHNFLCATHLCFVIIGQKVVILCQLAF